MTAPVGYVVLSRPLDRLEDWTVDHLGETWDQATAQEWAARWAHENPDYETAVAAVHLAVTE